jgi:hypothetical protein
VAPSSRQRTFFGGVVPGGGSETTASWLTGLLLVEAFVRQASVRVVTGERGELGVVNARRSRKAMAVGRVAGQRRGCGRERNGVRCQSSSGPSCSEVRSELSAASSRWPPRRQTIIPRRPEGLSIRLKVPIAFNASRSAVVTVLGTAWVRRGGHSWVMLLEGVVPTAGDSSERLSIHVVARKGIVATWS